MSKTQSTVALVSVVVIALASLAGVGLLLRQPINAPAPIAVSGQAVTSQNFYGQTINDYLHSFVHQGKVFSGYVYSATVPPTTTLDLLFKTDPTTTTTPLVPNVSLGFAAGGNAVASIYANVVITTTGVTLTLQNQDQNNVITPRTIVFSGPTISNTGTLLTQYYIATGGGKLTTFDMHDGPEWIFVPNRYYLIRLTNNAGSPTPMMTNFNFYEDTPQ